MRSRSRPFAIVLGLAAALLVAGLAVREVARRRDAALLPPLPDLSAVAPAVAAHVREAEAAARSAPRSPEAVGHLCLVLHADLFLDAAEVCYARASELASGDWRWQYWRVLLDEDRGLADRIPDGLRQVVALEPRFALAWFRIGEAEFKQGRLAEARAAYQRAIEAARAGAAASLPAGRETVVPPVEAFAALGLARVALSRGALADARSLVAPVVREHFAFGHARRLLREVERAAGARSDDGRRTATAGRAYAPPPDPFVDALARESRHSLVLLRHAALARRAGDRGWRETLVRRAIELHPDDPDVVFEMATMLHETRRSEEALAMYRRHERLAPGELQTLVQIGRCLTDLGRLDDAEDYLRQADQVGDATASYNLGVVLGRKGAWVEAAQAYERALALNPHHAGSHNNLGVILARDGRHADAMRRYEQAMASAPDEPDAYTNAGTLLLQQGRAGAAERRFEEAIDRDPQQADAHNNLGVALAQQGRLEEAIAAFRGALAIDGQHAGARRNLQEITGR